MTDRDQAGITRPRVRPQQASHSSVPPPTILHSRGRGDLGEGGPAALIALLLPCSLTASLIPLRAPRGDSPEERVVLNADLPEPLG